MAAYGLAAEADTLLRVEDGTLPNERLDTTSTTIDLVECDLTNDLVAVVSVMSIVSLFPAYFVQCQPTS